MVCEEYFYSKNNNSDSYNTVIGFYSVEENLNVHKRIFGFLKYEVLHCNIHFHKSCKVGTRRFVKIWTFETRTLLH